MAGQFLNRFGTFVYPFLTLFLSDRAFSGAQIALVFAALAIGSLSGPLFSGYLTDAIGRRNTMLISLVTGAGMVVGLFHVRGFVETMAVAALYGFVRSLFDPAASALLTDLVPAERRITAFAMFRLAINAGFAAGPAVAGILFSRAPAWIFYGDAFTTLTFALLVYLWIPHGLRTIEGRVSSPRVAWESWCSSLKALQQHVAYRQFLGALLLMAICFSQIFNLLALTTRGRGLTPAQYGLIMGANGLIIILIELPITQWYRRFRPQTVLAFGYVLISLGAMAFAFAETFSGFLLAMAVFTLGEIIALPMGLVYSSGLAPEAFRGRFFGFRAMTWALAGLVGSSGIWFYDQIGALWWLLIGLLPLLAALRILQIPKTLPSLAPPAPVGAEETLS